jgi:hypothetical protein
MSACAKSRQRLATACRSNAALVSSIPLSTRSTRSLCYLSTYTSLAICVSCSNEIACWSSRPWFRHRKSNMTVRITCCLMILFLFVGIPGKGCRAYRRVVSAGASAIVQVWQSPAPSERTISGRWAIALGFRGRVHAGISSERKSPWDHPYLCFRTEPAGRGPGLSVDENRKAQIEHRRPVPSSDARVLWI